MKLIIVDDDALIRKSLTLTLNREPDIEVAANASNGAEALELCRLHQPDAVLMDIRMPGIDGIGATRLIKDEFPHVRVMILTTFADKPNIEDALTAGADGYLVKTDKIAAIAGKLRILMEGTSILDAQVLRQLTKSENPLLQKLTPRERDIARLVSQGMTNKDIAEHLFLSAGTVRNNLAVIMEKLEVSNRTQLGMLYRGDN